MLLAGIIALLAILIGGNLKEYNRKKEEQIRLLQETKTKHEEEIQNLEKEKKDLEIKLQAKKQTTVRVASAVTGDALSNIIRVESGGNRLAVNKSSGACGLFQSLPCSKMLNWIGVSTLEEATYEQQVAWGKYYIQNRYGTPENAWAFWQSHHWY